MRDQYKKNAGRAYYRARKWMLVWTVRTWEFIKWVGIVCGREAFNAIIAGATTVYVFVAIAQWSAMQDQIGLARQEFESSQRPWVAISKVDSRSPLIFDKAGAHGIVFMTLENPGHSPATHVWAAQESFPLLPTSDPRREEQALCDKAGADKPAYGLKAGVGGITLFPNQTVDNFGIPIVVAQSDIDYALHHLVAGMPPNGYAIYLVGCFDYQFPWGIGHHHTPFAFEIDKPAPTPENPNGFFPMTNDQSTIPTVRILTNWVYGITAD